MKRHTHRKKSVLSVKTIAAAVAITCVCSYTFSGEAAPPAKKINLAPSKHEEPVTESNTAELLKNTKPIQPTTTGSGIQFSVNCTDTNGKAVSANDSGYEDCLKNSKQSVNPPNMVRQPKSNAGFKIGK